MSPFVSQTLFILLLIVLNGLLAMSEIAIVSARKVRLQQRADSGKRGAKAALSLAEQPTRFLSTVQVGITLIGILAGALGGAQVSQHLAILLRQIVWLRPYSQGLALAIVVVVTSYLSLVIGELVPKRLALAHAEGIASAVAGPMRFVSVLLAPAVHLLSASTDLIIRLLGIRPSSEPPVTEEEIRDLIDQGTEAGVFQAVEQDMVEGVLELDNLRVNSLMTPRPDIAWIDIDDPPELNQRKITDSQYSRFLVARGSLDEVLGEVQARDLLARSLSCEPFDLGAALRPPLYVPETMPVLKVLEAFKQSGTQMATVLDEYGGVQGIVTLTDIMKAIIGDLPSAEDLAEPQVVQREDGSWLMDGMLPIDGLKDRLHLETLPGEDQGLYQTLAGFVMTQLGNIPDPADHFVWAGFRFEVMDMDGPRVDKLLVSKVPPQLPEEDVDD